jgi:quercetin dioxygenase-like cupin family protein
MANGYRVEKWKHPYPPNPAMLRLELEAEGFRVLNWCDLPETSYGMHKHDSEQSHWVISGSIEITVANIAYVLSAGDRDHMPANTYHTARVVGEEPVTYLVGEKLEVADAKTRSRNSEILVESMFMMEKIKADLKAKAEAVKNEEPEITENVSDELPEEMIPNDDEKSRDEH